MSFWNECECPCGPCLSCGTDRRGIIFACSFCRLLYFSPIIKPCFIGELRIVLSDNQKMSETAGAVPFYGKERVPLYP